MAYTRQYTQGVGWENTPSINTPISAENLNQMDEAIKNVDAAAYTEFAAVYAAIAQAGGGNAVNFYIDNASNNTLASTSSVLSDITLKKNDIIFLYMSVDGDYTQAQTGWEVEYKMYVSGTLTTFTAVIRNYLRGEGAMWHDAFNLDLARGTWLILRVVDTTHFDCIGKIDPASSSGTGKVFSGLLGDADSKPYNGKASKTLTNYLTLSVDPSFELVDGSTVIFRRANSVGFSDQVQEGAQLYLNVNNTGAIQLRDADYNLITFTDYNDMNSYFWSAYTFTATYHKYDDVDPEAAYEYWEISRGNNIKVNVEDTAFSQLLETIEVDGSLYYIPKIPRPLEICRIESTLLPANPYTVDSDDIHISINNWDEWATNGSTVFFQFGPNTTVNWTSNGMVLCIYYGIGSHYDFDAYYNGVKVTDASVLTIDSNTVYMGVVREDRTLDKYVMDIFKIDNSSGGGGGTTVVANPSGTATDSLGKLQVGSTIYEIPGIDTAWAGKVTAVSGGNITPNNASFSFDPFTDGKFVILDIGVDAVMPGGVTSWSLQYTVDGNTVTRNIADKRNGNAYDPDFDDDLVSGSVIVLQYFGNNEFACVAVLNESGGGGGASTLAGLSDTAIASPAEAQPLTYDDTRGKWVNGGIIPAANGGTGNNSGYVRAGRKANTNIGVGATAEGANTTASGDQSHAEGYNTQATGRMTHAEGESTKATNGASHAEGAGTTASGNSSHAQGNNTTASGHYSSAAGRFTVAGYNDQFVIGKYNNNKSTSIFEVGIGTGSGATPKINGLELDTSGNLKTAGTITDGNGNVLGQPVAVDGVWVISGETATLTVTTP